MAVTKLKYLSDAGVQKLAEELIKVMNTKVADIIATELTSPGDDTHAPSTKAVIDKLGVSGTASDETAFGQIKNLQDKVDALGPTEDGKIDDLEAKIGTKEDTSDKDTVYGAMKKQEETLKEYISGLNHLTYQVVEEGEISATNPETRNTNVLYLQHDSAEDKSYEIWIWTGSDGSTGDYYVSGEETPDAQEGDTADKWICIGDTSLDLADYWKHTDENVTALQTEMLVAISDEEITTAVQTAYTSAADTKFTPGVGA